MYRSKRVRLYHPKEVAAMKKVCKKLGKHPKQEVTQKEMWKAIRAARIEILNEQKANKDATQGKNNKVQADLHSTGTHNPVQQREKQKNPL